MPILSLTDIPASNDAINNPSRFNNYLNKFNIISNIKSSYQSNEDIPTLDMSIVDKQKPILEYFFKSKTIQEDIYRKNHNNKDKHFHFSAKIFSSSKNTDDYNNSNVRNRNFLFLNKGDKSVLEDGQMPKSVGDHNWSVQTKIIKAINIFKNNNSKVLIET
jgi:hypothetical protein